MKQRLCFSAPLGLCFSRLLSPFSIAVTLMVSQPASAQLVGSRSVQATTCASAVGGDVRDTTITVVCGMPSEQVVALVGLAASPQAGDRAELMARLSALVPASSQLRVEAIAKFFQLLGELPVEEDRLADRFAQIAEEHRRFAGEVKSLRVSDPEVQALRQEAVAALEIGDHATASARYEQARAIPRTKRETLARILDDQKREEATLVFEQARVELARLAYEQAATLFAEAARLLPAGDIRTRWEYLIWEASTQQTMGDERGNNAALMNAIDRYRAALLLAPRMERPLDWAETQQALGAALSRLGKRESGTERLEAAITAYRAALEEITRTRSPDQWATVQHDLGVALRILGERENGTARLEEAVVALRAALEELTRERAPHDWAMSQMSLGNALATLGLFESGTERFEDAVKAYRSALAEVTREHPREWTMIQSNLGYSLLILGLRGTGTERLEEAIAVLRAALAETTRERPLDWAEIQCNLGAALGALGERESGTARLEEAVVALRAALEEFTRERAPLEWGETFGHQGLALMNLAERTRDAVMAQTALQQIEAAVEVLRADGDVRAAIFEPAYPTLAESATRLRTQAEIIGRNCHESDMSGPSNYDDLQAPRCKRVAVW